MKISGPRAHLRKGTVRPHYYYYFIVAWFLSPELWITTSAAAKQRGSPFGLRRTDHFRRPWSGAGAAHDDGLSAAHRRPGVQTYGHHGSSQSDPAHLQWCRSRRGPLRVHGKFLLGASFCVSQFCVCVCVWSWWNNSCGVCMVFKRLGTLRGLFSSVEFGATVLESLAIWWEWSADALQKGNSEEESKVGEQRKMLKLFNLKLECSDCCRQ